MKTFFIIHANLFLTLALAALPAVLGAGGFCAGNRACRY